MEIKITERFPLEVENYKELINKTCKECLLVENFKDNVEISILFTNNEEIQQINKEMRSINKITDVLSFPSLKVDKGIPEINELDINPENQLIILGDIVISVEKIVEQAGEYGHSLKRELCFLISHAMYHLMGYDHKDSIEEEIMFNKQEQALSNLGIYR